MATGASTADVAILLVDARHGVREQTRRHARIARLLGITALRARRQQDGSRRFRRAGLRRASATTSRSCCRTRGSTPSRSARCNGDNVITPSDRTPWFDGPACSSISRRWRSIGNARRRRSGCRCSSSSVPIRNSAATPGRLSSGTIRVGDPVTAWPSGRTARVKRIVTWDGDLDEAFAPMSVTLVLEDEIDISRGDVLARRARRRSAAGSKPTWCGWTSGRSIRARLYLLKHTTRTVTAEVNRGARAESDRDGDGHDVAAARLRPLRATTATTGSFILIDPGDQLHRRRRHDRRRGPRGGAAHGAGRAAAERLARSRARHGGERSRRGRRGPHGCSRRS